MLLTISILPAFDFDTSVGKRLTYLLMVITVLGRNRHLIKTVIYFPATELCGRLWCSISTCYVIWSLKTDWYPVLKSFIFTVFFIVASIFFINSPFQAFHNYKSKWFQYDAKRINKPLPCNCSRHCERTNNHFDS